MVTVFQRGWKFILRGTRMWRISKMVEVIPPGEDPLVLRGLMTKEDEKKCFMSSGSRG